jgi:peptidoglycan/xylan/chitin deacetylase (PgdA/CDA1 family)
VISAAFVAAVLIVFLSKGPLRWGLLSVLCTGTGLVVGLGVSFPSWRMFGPAFCRARTTRKAVALTFDDGPDPATTPALLDLLKERKTPATFFCVGQKTAEHPELAARIAREGHEVENHSWAHDFRTNLFSEAKLRSDLARAQSQLKVVCGTPPRFFRPPMGLTNQRVFRVAGELGLEIAGYTARGLDRRNDAAEVIAERILAASKPGAILLLHDAGVPKDKMLTVAGLVLEGLRRREFECVRLDVLRREHQGDL